MSFLTGVLRGGWLFLPLSSMWPYCILSYSWFILCNSFIGLHLLFGRVSVKCQKCRWIACGFFPDELLYVTRGLKWEMKRTIRDLSSLKELLQHPPFIVQLLSVYDDWQCLPGLTSLSSWSAAYSRLEWCFLQGNHTVDA